MNCRKNLISILNGIVEVIAEGILIQVYKGKTEQGNRKIITKLISRGVTEEILKELVEKNQE